MSLPKEHTVYRSYGRTLDELKKETASVPTPSKGEVLVKVKSVALNSRDYQVIVGSYPLPIKKNVIPGSDMAGEVVAVGDNVHDVKVGDSVISNFKVGDVWDPQGGVLNAFGGDNDGVLREYVLAPEEAVNKINRPKGFSWEEAASLVCTGVTTWNALYGLKRLTVGDYVLLIGTGGAALTALSIAKAAGAVTIITSSSDKKLAAVKKDYGADYTINYNTTPDWEKEVLKITGNKGVDHIVETGGNGTISKSIACVAAGGVISLVGYMAPRPQDNPEVFLPALTGGAILRGIRVGSKQQAQELIKFVESSKDFHIEIGKVYNFHKDEVVKALSELATSTSYGKVCISFE